MRRITMVIFRMVLSILAGTCVAQTSATEPSREQVLFVCEHGNVKSLMAASYFNELARARGLPFRAISRGTAPDSTSVPAPIAKALRGDGFDVSSFRPTAVTKSDVLASKHVVAISSDFPDHLSNPGRQIERWDDVPAASVDYAAARASLKAHVEKLLEQLVRE